MDKKPVRRLYIDIVTDETEFSNKKNKILPFAVRMDAIGGHLVEWNKLDSERQILFALIFYVASLYIQANIGK